MMYSYLIVLLMACSALAVAVPGEVTSRTTPSESCGLKSFFDTRLAGAVPVSVGPTTAVGTEGALNYPTFTLASNTESLISNTLNVFIQPPSKPNWAASGLVGKVTLGQQPQLLPANSTVQYFNFESIAYACVTNVDPAPITCTIRVIGTKGKAYGGGQVTKDLIYNPGPVIQGGPVKQFGTSTFPQLSFTGLVALTFPQPSLTGLVALTLSITSAATGPATNLLIDNVGYHACISK